jgi:hypothetical protein
MKPARFRKAPIGTSLFQLPMRIRGSRTKKSIERTQQTPERPVGIGREKSLKRRDATAPFAKVDALTAERKPVSQVEMMLTYMLPSECSHYR